LRGAWVEGETLDTPRGRILLRQPSRASCVDYETRFGTPTFRASDSSAAIVSQTQWLWRPEPFPHELDASVRFVLPADGQVSLPWPRSDAIYFPEQSAFFTSVYGVFGSFDRQSFSVASTNVDIARLGSRPADDDTRRWLGRAVQATASLGGRFPRDRVHFIVVPMQSQGQQVVFGMVRRGGGVPSPDATVEELEGDWVAVHELSHLWLPRLYAGDRWISEGIATYLQEVLRARCGLQSNERAWTRLQEGFERGRRSGTGRQLASESRDMNRTGAYHRVYWAGAAFALETDGQLASESRDMNRTGAYHRVYWAGAAFALETDVLLRKNSDGEMTLLRAISDAQRVWGSEARPVGASVLLKALQEASGAGVDSPEYREIRARITSSAHEACGVSAESSR
jgi:hypothetical protein